MSGACWARWKLFWGIILQIYRVKVDDNDNYQLQIEIDNENWALS